MSEQNRDYLYEKFQEGDIPNSDDFKDMIDSALNYADDGLTSYKVMNGKILAKRFGIGDKTPQGPLGIKGEDSFEKMIFFTSSDDEQRWNINLHPVKSEQEGFSIDDGSDGNSVSRMFIEVKTGKTGFGTTAPSEKMQVEGYAENEYVSSKIKNSGTDHYGWMFGHYYDSSSISSPLDGSFAIIEDDASGKVPRITFLPRQSMEMIDFYNVGINEPMPYATLHVSRPANDPLSDINLAENSGILLLGPIDDLNLGLDSHQIQARQGSVSADGKTLAFTVSDLNLQPIGGDINIHSRLSEEKQFIFTETGQLGIGRSSVYQESLEVNGAITIGNSATSGKTASGTIRWNGKDFEGSIDGKWYSFTRQEKTDGIWTMPGGPDTNLIYFAPERTRVGIGTEDPRTALHVQNKAVTDGNTVAATISNTASISSSTKYARIGLSIENTGPWSPSAEAQNVGLYIGDVSGQGSAEANITALLNGNVVIGDFTGQALVGPDGSNVLAIQTGTVPGGAIGSTTSGGIQIYSDDITGSSGSPVSIFNLMNGDGSVIQLFSQSKLTAVDINVPNTGNATTDAIIDNTRLRLKELEERLMALGLLV